MKTPDTINGKMPEEIKKDAETCMNHPYMDTCNSCRLYKECHGISDHIVKEMYDLVLHYESRLAQAERERDALIRNHIPQTCDTCKYSLRFSFDNPCNTCDHLYRFNAVERGDTDRWEFVGICEENTKEDER